MRSLSQINQAFFPLSNADYFYVAINLSLIFQNKLLLNFSVVHEILYFS